MRDLNRRAAQRRFDLAKHEGCRWALGFINTPSLLARGRSWRSKPACFPDRPSMVVRDTGKITSRTIVAYGQADLIGSKVNAPTIGMAAVVCINATLPRGGGRHDHIGVERRQAV